MLNTSAALCLLVPVVQLLGCAASPLAADRELNPGATSAIVIDGDTSEWTPTTQPVSATADGKWISIRFAPAQSDEAIQAAPFTTRILIDADSDSTTGVSRVGLGVELEVLLSPPNELGGVGIGSAVYRATESGRRESIGHASAGFVFLPSFASPVYEARVRRDALDRFPDAHNATIRVDQIDPNGSVRWAGVSETALPETGGGTTPERAAIPKRVAGSVRVLSQNVLRSAPMQDPEPFARLVESLDADAVLFQEWFGTSAADQMTWIKTHLGEDWTVIGANENTGVSVATRLAVVEGVPNPIPSGGRPPRMTAAVVATDAGPMILASLHLKCCGSASSDEDRRRVSEAAAINAAIGAISERYPGAGIVVAGDYNLVGTRRPLDTAADSLAADGSDLTPAYTRRLNDTTTTTWVDEKSRFSPGRLDWMLFDASTHDAIHSASVDTRLLSDADLQASGLERSDSAASDHLTLLLDLRAKR